MARPPSKPRRTRLRVREWLTAREMSAYALAKASGGRISEGVAYRLARDEWHCIGGDVMDALCDVLKVEPADLLTREPPPRPPAPRRGR